MEDYHRIFVTPTAGIVTNDTERQQAAMEFRNALKLREKFLYAPIKPEHTNQTLLSFQEQVRNTPLNVPLPLDTFGDLTQYTVVFGDDGIGKVVPINNDRVVLLQHDTFAPPFSLDEFNDKVTEIWKCCTGKVTRTFAFRRLRMLDVNYEFHTLMNETYELTATRDDKADFEQITKVDIHLHAASAFTREELLVVRGNRLLQ